MVEALSGPMLLLVGIVLFWAGLGSLLWFVTTRKRLQ